MMPARWVWYSLCAIAYWNKDGLKTRFTIGDYRKLNGDGYYWSIGFMA